MGNSLSLQPPNSLTHSHKRLKRYTVKEVLDYLRGRYLSWPQIEERNQLLDRMTAEVTLDEADPIECQDSQPASVMALISGIPMELQSTP